MLFYTFDGYEGFKEIFELQEHGNGVKSRRNKILLALYKTRGFLKYVRENEDWNLAAVTSMQSLLQACLLRIQHEADKFPGKMELKGRVFGSDTYKTDHWQGKTEDGDKNAIRYARLDTGKIYKMKAGKMYRHLIQLTDFGKMLPEQVVVWLCEELTREWCGWNIGTPYQLHVDDDFEAIYNRENYKGDFGSCMANRRHWTFYRDSVKAKAAYLTDEDGRMVARAVIFTDVTDEETGKILRLCERQYSSNGDETLKQALVNQLIDGGYIDGYKRIGADCHSSRAWVSNDGDDWSDKDFRIDCSLDYDDTVSYQDSFKWYDKGEELAYNYEDCSYDYKLDTTEDTIEGDNNYDEYHEVYTSNDVVRVYYRGDWITCDEYELDDFVSIDGDYYHEDYVSYCDYCEEAYLSENGIYSDITGEDYCCGDCKEEAERQYCEDHPDEYVWLHGEAVDRGDVIFCPQCGAVCLTEDAEYSELTEEFYDDTCCMYEAEKEYCIEHTEYIYPRGWDEEYGTPHMNPNDGLYYPENYEIPEVELETTPENEAV